MIYHVHRCAGSEHIYEKLTWKSGYKLLLMNNLTRVRSYRDVLKLRGIIKKKYPRNFVRL